MTKFKGRHCTQRKRWRQRLAMFADLPGVENQVSSY
ncbi:hypothetical protein LTSERUB_3642, partial [Salmonella enterica subsp. enterica serovar Rubislaw str. A4-653]